MFDTLRRIAAGLDGTARHQYAYLRQLVLDEKPVRVGHTVLWRDRFGVYRDNDNNRVTVTR